MRRCEACEESYALLRLDRRDQPLTGWMLAVAYACAALAALVAALTLRSEPELVVLVALAASGTPLYIIALRRAVLRSRFLAERPGRRRLALSGATLCALSRSRGMSPRDDQLAFVSLLLCVLSIPPLPTVGLGLAIFVCCAWERRASRRDRGLAIPAVLLGVGWSTLHVAWLAYAGAATAMWALAIALAVASLALLLTIGRRELLRRRLAKGAL